MEKKMRRKAAGGITYIYVLNIAAIIAVLFLHHNGIVHHYSDDRSWATSLLFETVFYWAVPIFYMNTGATLIGYRKRYDTKTFFKKRFSKIIIPLIVWSLIMYFWKVSTNQIAAAASPIAFVNSFFAHGFEFTYYFMFTILGIYLTIPVVSFIADKDGGAKVLQYIAALIFISISTLPVILKLFGIYWSSDFAILIGGLMIFPILGYLLSQKELSKKKRIIIYLLGIGSCLFRYLYTFISSSQKGSLDGTLFNYVQFHSILLAMAVFVFAKQIQWERFIKKENSKKALASIAGCSFGIFLVHMIIIYYEKLIFGIDARSIVFRTLLVPITYIISLALVFLLKKIPIIRKIVP